MIYGFEDDGPWMQKIFHQFHSRPSPIVPNETPKDVLEEILDGNQQDYVIPVVVMLENNCPIKNGKFCTNEKI